MRLLPATCRWNDTVHAKILDHLPLVIETMSCGKRCLEEAGGLPATPRSNRFDEVRALQGRDRFVAEREGIFHKLMISAFAFMLSGPLPSLTVSGDFSSVIGDQIRQLDAAICFSCSPNVRTPL